MFNQTLEAVTDYLATALVGHTPDVASHPGRFTESELSRLLTARQAVRIAIENTQTLTVSGQGLQQATLLMAAFVICSDHHDRPRHQQALSLTQAIIQQLPFNRFNTSFLKPVQPGSISAENLYSGEIDRKGIALWGISWEQTVVNPSS